MASGMWDVAAIVVVEEMGACSFSLVTASKEGTIQSLLIPL